MSKARILKKIRKRAYQEAQEQEPFEKLDDEGFRAYVGVEFSGFLRVYKTSFAEDDKVRLEEIRLGLLGEDERLDFDSRFRLSHHVERFKTFDGDFISFREYRLQKLKELFPSEMVLDKNQYESLKDKDGYTFFYGRSDAVKLARSLFPDVRHQRLEPIINKLLSPERERWLRKHQEQQQEWLAHKQAYDRMVRSGEIKVENPLPSYARKNPQKWEGERSSGIASAPRDVLLLYDRSKDAYILGESALNDRPTKRGETHVRVSDAVVISPSVHDPSGVVYWNGQELRNSPHDDRFFYEVPRSGSLKLKRDTFEVIAMGARDVVGYLGGKTGLYDLAGAVALAYDISEHKKPKGKRWDSSRKVKPKKSSASERNDSSWNYSYGGIPMGDLK